MFKAPEEVRTVAVIGAGLIGAGWTAAFMARGLDVRVSDPSPDAEARVRDHVAHALPQLRSLGLAAGATGDLVFTADVVAATTGADFVQENAPEREEIKRDLYRRLDATVPPHVLIASSTSSYAITQIQSVCLHPARCVMGHPFNPVHLIPLVEVGGGEATDPRAVQAAMDFYRHVGKHPVRLDREIFGHVANRLASAMFREAIHLVESGVTTVRGIDDALRFGPALKWAIQGQFLTYYTSGGDGGMARFLESFGPGQEKRWAQLGDPHLTPALKAMLVAQTEEVVAGRAPADIAAAQDALLVRLLDILIDS